LNENGRLGINDLAGSRPSAARSRDVFNHFHFDIFTFVGRAAALGRRISVFAE